MREPLPHQIPALEYAQKHKTAGIFLDMRLGKTFCAAQWARHHGAKKILVVAPKSAIPGWLDETEADSDDLTWDLTNPVNMRQWVQTDGDLPGRFFIINPQGLFKAGRGDDPSPREIALWNWPAVIWDETATLKNPQSQINKVARLCLGDVPLRCGLSGEYAPEGALDVFEGMRWIFGSFMGRTNFWKWRNANFEQDGYDWVPQRGKLEEIRRVVAERCFVLSREDAGLGQETHFDRRYCDLPPKIKRTYDHAEVYFEVPANVDAEDGGRSDETIRPTRYTSYVPVVRNWLTQIAGGRPKHFPDLHSDHKLRLLGEVVLNERRYEPLVVSFRHNDEMFAAFKYLTDKGCTATMVWGALDVAERRTRSQKFRDGKVRVFLKQEAVHYGMDLSRADTMLRYSIGDAWNNISQNFERIVHPQKKRPLLYVDLLTRDTVDEDLSWASKEKKMTARFFMTRAENSFFARMQRKMRELKK